MSEKTVQNLKNRKLPVRYVLVVLLILAAALISLFFTLDFYGGGTAAGLEPLFSGKQFTENELLEIELAFADAQLSNYQISNGMVQVPAARKQEFILALKKTSIFEEESAPTSNASGFWISERERQAAVLKEKQNALSTQLRTFKGIENARVILDVCETRNGFVREKHASASISIRSRNEYQISDADIQSILRLVSGAIYGISSANVFIIDTRTNQSWKFDAPQIETVPASETSDGSKQTAADTQSVQNQNYRKIVFQTEPCPQPEVFDSAARTLLSSQNEERQTVQSPTVCAPASDETSSQNSIIPGRISLNAQTSNGIAPESVGKTDLSQNLFSVSAAAPISASFSSPNTHISPVSANETVSPAADTGTGKTELFGTNAPETLDELALFEAQSDRSSETILTNTNAPKETGDSQPTHHVTNASRQRPQTVSYFFGLLLSAVIFVCVFVIYLTRKGLFATPEEAEFLRKKANPIQTTSNSSNVSVLEEADSAISETDSENDSENDLENLIDSALDEISIPAFRGSANEVSENAFEKVSETETSVQPLAHTPIENGKISKDETQNTKISEILQTLESLKNEESQHWESGLPENSHETQLANHSENGSKNDSEIDWTANSHMDSYMDSHMNSPAESNDGTQDKAEALEENAEIDEKDLESFQSADLPEIEHLRLVPPERLALAFLEERPQTAALLLTQFSRQLQTKILSHIPTHIRLGIESRLTRCSSPDETILRDAASAILEHLAEMHAQTEANLDEVSSSEESKPIPHSELRPLADVLPKKNSPKKPVLETIQSPQEMEALEKSNSTTNLDTQIPRERKNSETAQALEPADLLFDFEANQTPEEDAETGSESANVQDNSPSWTFEELNFFSDADLCIILASSKPEEALLALTGADSELVTRILNILPKSEAAFARNQLANPGRIRLLDIENARQSILRLTQDLVERKRIHAPEPAKVA